MKSKLNEMRVEPKSQQQYCISIQHAPDIVCTAKLHKHFSPCLCVAAAAPEFNLCHLPAFRYLPKKKKSVHMRIQLNR